MSPTWSPDGRQIAFLSNRAEGWDLYTMPAAGGEATRLTSGATADSPAWSTDGGWIAVERNDRIEAVSPDGSARKVLVEDASQPAWSPSQQLAFVRNRDLYVLEVDGTERLILRDADQPHGRRMERPLSLPGAGSGSWMSEAAGSGSEPRIQ